MSLKAIYALAADPIMHQVERERARLDWEPKDLASKVGMSWRYYLKLRRGEKHPAPKTLRRLLRALGLELAVVRPKADASGFTLLPAIEPEPAKRRQKS